MDAIPIAAPAILEQFPLAEVVRPEGFVAHHRISQTSAESQRGRLIDDSPRDRRLDAHATTASFDEQLCRAMEDDAAEL